MQEILKIEDICKALSISRPTVVKLIKSGDLKAFRVLKSWRIFKKDFDEYLKKALEIKKWE